MKNFFLHFLKIAFALLIIGYLIYAGKIDLNKIAGSFKNLPLIFSCLFVFCIILFNNTLRWKILLSAHGSQLNYLQTLKLTFVGHFFNMVMPGAVGGDLIKAYYVVGQDKQKTNAVLSIFLDRLVGIVALVLVALVAILLNLNFIWQKPELRALSSGMIGIVVGLFLFSPWLFSRRVAKHKIILKLPGSRFLQKIFDALYLYRKQPQKLALAIGLSFITHTLSVFMFYLIARSLGENLLSLIHYFFIVPLGMVTLALPISPAGLGIGQGAYLKLFDWVSGTPTTIGADTCSIYQMIIFIWSLTGIFFYLRVKRK